MASTKFRESAIRDPTWYGLARVDARLLLENGLQQRDGIETHLGTAVGQLRQDPGAPATACGLSFAPLKPLANSGGAAQMLLYAKSRCKAIWPDKLLSPTVSLP